MPRPKKTKAQKIGDRGENRIVTYLKTFLSPNNVLHNIILTNGDSTSQIDCIAVTDACIYVIEIKNFCADRIYCNPEAMYWYYILPAKGGTSQKCTFYNPIAQNQTHCRLINELFDGTVPVRSMVVFAKNNPLDFGDFEQPSQIVKLANLKDELTWRKGNLSEETQKAIIKCIKKHNRTDVTLAEHIDNITKNKKIK